MGFSTEKPEKTSVEGKRAFDAQRIDTIDHTLLNFDRAKTKAHIKATSEAPTPR